MKSPVTDSSEILRENSCATLIFKPSGPVTAEMMIVQEAVEDRLRKYASDPNQSNTVWSAHRTFSSARVQPIEKVVLPRATMSICPALKVVGMVRRLSVFTIFFSTTRSGSRINYKLTITHWTGSLFRCRCQMPFLRGCTHIRRCSPIYCLNCTSVSNSEVLVSRKNSLFKCITRLL